MYRYYFKNLITSETFFIEEDNPEMMRSRIRKAKYSGKIKYLGRIKVWG